MLARQCCAARPAVARSQPIAQPPRPQHSRCCRVQSGPHVLDPSVKVDRFRRHEDDAGSSEVQVAQLTGRIIHITKHLQKNRKDKAGQQGLICLLSQRKKLLKYMYREDKQAFARCIRELGIRNPIQGVRVQGEKASKEKANKKVASKSK